MIRTIIFWIIMAPHTIVHSLLVIFAAMFDRSGKVFLRLSQSWSRIILRIAGARVVVEGGENVNLDEPRIYVSNHQSYFDVFAIMAFLPGNARFVAKKSLEYIPFFGTAMRASGTIILDKSQPEKAREQLKRGATKNLGGMRGVIIFPEGTRSRDGSLGQFKLGGFVLAIQAQVPVIPIAVTGSREIMPADSLRIKSGEIRIRIGNPIPTRGLSLDDRHSLTENARCAVEELLTNRSRTAMAA